MTDEKLTIAVAGRQLGKTNTMLRTAETMLNERNARIAQLKTVLRDAQQKLQLYREQHSGEYIGGVEFGELMSRINAELDRE